MADESDAPDLSYGSVVPFRNKTTQSNDVTSEIAELSRINERLGSALKAADGLMESADQIMRQQNALIQDLVAELLHMSRTDAVSKACCPIHLCDSSLCGCE